MKFKKYLTIILTLFVCIGLQSISTYADSLETMVFSDGSQLAVQQFDGGEEMGLAEPYQGTLLSVQELINEGAIVESYPDVEALLALEPVTSGVGIETLIGLDTRIRTYTMDYPARAVALVTFDGGRCTGWFIGSDTVATAGHCVHSGGTSGSWRTNFTIYPGYDQTSAPYGSCGASWAASVAGWVQNQSEKYDYGVIKLDCDVGNTVGWFGFLWKSGKDAMKNFPEAITGYPGDKSLEQWQSHDKVRQSNKKQIFYRNDTIGGMSGSPIWFDKGTKGPYGIGIHAYGLHGTGAHSTLNHGTRITEARFNNLLNWINAPK